MLQMHVMLNRKQLLKANPSTKFVVQHILTRTFHNLMQTMPPKLIWFYLAVGFLWSNTERNRFARFDDIILW
jgi:hypothetical protein